MLLCVLIQEPNDSNICASNPAGFTNAFFYYCFLPFVMLRLIAIAFCRSTPSIWAQIALIWLGNMLAVTIWELMAIDRFTKMSGCPFDIAYFNLCFYFMCNLHVVFALIFLLVGGCKVYGKARDGAEEINTRVRNIRELPSEPYRSNVHTAQKFCIICMDDFQDDSGHMVTWLSCDVRHFFHTECVKHWLHRQNRCPLCKAEVDYKNIAAY